MNVVIRNTCRYVAQTIISYPMIDPVKNFKYARLNYELLIFGKWAKICCILSHFLCNHEFYLHCSLLQETMQNFQTIVEILNHSNPACNLEIQ